jgi:adenylate cyclase
MADSHLAVAWSDEQRAAIRAQLDRLLAGASLHQSPQQQRLLRHIVEATLAGDAARLKGYTLGVEVLGRGAGFDANADPIVRVEAGRLRSKLLAYYSGDGADDPVLIDVPKGAYEARFVLRERGRSTIGWPAISHVADARERPSIAVLPFANLSGDPQQQYFADGITEDLLTELAKLAGLFVISRHTVFAVPRSGRRIQAIAAELGVRYLLEGSVRRAGDRLRISAQLIDAHRDEHLWAQRYDCPCTDVFAVQDDVTRQIVRALAVKLTLLEDARIAQQGTASLDAYDCVQRGIALFRPTSREAFTGALAQFRRATELDGDYAAAHAWLARALLYWHLEVWDLHGEPVLPEVFELAERAVLLDPLLPMAHTSLSNAHTWAGAGAAAIASGRRAVALEPNGDYAHAFLAHALLSSNRLDEALQVVETGIRLSPRLTTVLYRAKGGALCYAGRPDEATAVFEQSLGDWPQSRPCRIGLAACHAMSGRMEQARRQVELVRAASPNGELVYRSNFIDPGLRRRHGELMQRLGFRPMP